MDQESKGGQEAMKEGATKRALFVCSGNFYRSRLAELLFNHYAGKTGLAWRSDSRGVLERVRHKGLAPHAMAYLEKRELTALGENPRDPMVLRMDDLEACDLMVVLSQREHEPMLLTRFGQIPRIMASQNRMRYWNIDDLPPPRVTLLLWLQTLLDKRPPALGQSTESATEHIDFAVQALVRELLEKDSD